MNIDKERKDFERACVSYAEATGYDESDLRLDRNGEKYIDTPTQAAWWAWQARAALATQPAASDEHLIETGCYQAVIDRHSQPAASAEPSDEEIAAILGDVLGKDVRPTAVTVDFARALLSRYGRPAGDAQPIRLEHMAVADEDGLRWMSGRKIPAGVESVELYAVPGYGKAPKFVYTAPVSAGDAQHYEAVLRQIGDYAHDHSTGPAVPDALWAVRSLAYDALSDAPVAAQKADDAKLPAKIPAYEAVGGEYPSNDSYQEGYAEGWNAAIDAAIAQQGKGEV